ncbi:MAG: exopolyphosphatase-related protein [Candidatus Magnetoglobus multicellularis str. Araruama]|uniref:Exopolyphosphatase-related protein n=1 Tax=Candidatus Magnetoglobus multicellularis str. Araruama TaxID=890399 RepID=A0A1V1NZN2_9BACT|nr:MAG: exopolyphosphatase-related protein [Candidatus Magnetoglobus multicellularis str. Araruama]
MRLITRSDFDGLACAVLLVEAGIVDEYKFVHPKDVQDGIIEVTENDVLTNIPYVPGCGLWFDHHSSEQERLQLDKEFHYKGLSKEAPSCARVIYDYYGGDERFLKFEKNGLMEGVDKSDSGQLTLDEILNPKGWILLSFVMDPRTGLGRYRDYRISNYQLMEKMIEYCQTMSADEILQVSDVQERVKRYYEQEEAYEKMIRENSTVKKNLLIIDLRNVDEFVSGNRFKEYVLYPEQNISMRIIWGFKKQNVVFTVGHSIVNRTSKTNIGSMMLKYGGGGHRAVGTCQIPTDQWEKVQQELIDKIISDG